jgi:anaerobic magnesium-protoporphyrin IX monomethyl ester cyclase
MTKSDQPRGLRVCLLTLYLHESLGARQIDAVLRAHGHHSALVFFKEFRWGEFSAVKPQEEELLLALLRDLQPQLVGLNLTSSFVADLAYGLSEKIRKCLGVPTIFGGAHASSAPEECLPHADFVCVGEGEEAIVELADALAAGRPTEAIANLWTKVSGEVQRNDVRPLTQDLDRYPPVTYGEPESYFIENGQVQELDPATLLAMYHTTASRMACPFNCTFCGSVYLRRELYAGKGPVRRYRSVGAILEEVKRARERNPRFGLVQFWDEVFAAGASPDWTDEFCARWPAEIGLPFGIWSHGAMVTEDLIVKLKAAGLASVVIGIESGSEQVRKEVLGRRETNARILASAEILRRHEIETGYDFILDIPWLAEENCEGTFDLLLQLPRPFSVGLHSLSFLPRTGLAERALKEGMITPQQLGRADQPLAERFELHLWKYRVARTRRTAYWHSLIYLAGVPFVPHSLLRRLRRLKPLLQLFPLPLALAAEVARLKQTTGELQLFEALAAIYPGPAAFLARHPLLARSLHALLRPCTRFARRALRV